MLYKLRAGRKKARRFAQAENAFGGPLKSPQRCNQYNQTPTLKSSDPLRSGSGEIDQERETSPHSEAEDTADSKDEKKVQILCHRRAKMWSQIKSLELIGSIRRRS